MYSAIWAIPDRGSVRSVFVVALAMALVGALYVPAQAQTGGAAAPSWRGSQGAGALPAANGPGQGSLHRPRRAASAQTSSNLDIESLLYNFCSQGGVYCTDGIQPFAALIQDASGNFYGTTIGGGSTNSSDCNAGSCGYGTVFKLTPSGSGYTKSVLYNFCSQTNCTDGANPYAGLVDDAAGDLYGTTYNGGANGGGTVFKLTPSGNGYTESVLYNFCSQSQGSNFCTDGVGPYAGLIEDSSGNLYGTTNLGGTGVPLVNEGYAYGTVFMLAPSGTGYNYTVLYNFCPPGGNAFCTDGAAPNAALILDASGNLYGTTALGGTGTQNCIGLGCGTVFKLSPNGSGYVETVLYSFCSQGGNNCTDGGYPYAGLIEDASGNFYGTTSDGGVNSCDTPGCGTVFKLAPNGDGSYTESVLHSFDYTDGDNPDAVLIEDASGNLYGTTSSGGTGLSWECEGCSSGTVFELSPSGNGYTETVLYSFCSQGGTECTDGAVPMAGVIQDASGNLYGTTEAGGVNGIDWGTVFKLSPPPPPPPGFTVSASPTSLTITAGQSGTATFTVTPTGGFTGAISLSCAITPTAPSDPATCSVPASVTISGSAPQTTTLTVNTTAPNAAISPGRRSFWTSVNGAALACILLVGIPARRRGWSCRLGMLVLLFSVIGSSLGCGGGGNGGGGGGGGGTTPGTYTITVTGTSGTLTQTGTVSLTVQ